MGKKFPEIKGNMGFGLLRVPQFEQGVVDIEQEKKMVDIFMEAGFNYFDTSHNYLGGASEASVKPCITDRYPRDSYILADKLSRAYFSCPEDIRPLFQKQLDICGVDYFDFYIMHSQNMRRYKMFTERGAYEVVKELKEEGKIRHIGISFHDKADVLELILSEHPEIEVVQVQFNYYDYESPSIESRKVYEVARKYDKAVFIMEPLRGGSLVKHMPDEAVEEFAKVGGGTPASYGYRFAGSFEGVEVVLSGASDIQQMKENVETFKDFKPLNEEEMETVFKVTEILKGQDIIGCTACRYCVDGCPVGILIPDIFACYNAVTQFPSDTWSTETYYHEDLTLKNNKASDCIKCGACELTCPQELPIRELLEKCVDRFEKQERTLVK